MVYVLAVFDTVNDEVACIEEDDLAVAAIEGRGFAIVLISAKEEAFPHDGSLIGLRFFKAREWFFWRGGPILL